MIEYPYLFIGYRIENMDQFINKIGQQIKGKNAELNKFYLKLVMIKHKKQKN